MKKLSLIIVAAVLLCAWTVNAQYVFESWGLTYTNVGLWTNTADPGVLTNNATTNISTQPAYDFWGTGLKPVTLLLSVYSTNCASAGTADPQPATLVFTPSPDKVTYYSDEYYTNNQRMNIWLSNSNTTYTWKKFDPGTFRYWKVTAFEKPSTNFLVTNILLKVYLAK